ncbi:MAG: rRNA maturation RNase YbeY [Sulfurimonas sp.]|uniref:rRNA maturation RNase YbeY n=1 Tax=Sulfurimonas sp. TaxID=2022749 RepID=UPI00261FF072|nr:rRNA maturation RNase YbeY [Sulfurimonas sp.]MCW8895156.1 rRNA maturation RNase YbeY [Sulfurimonas sp.]MCW8954883.1 rRNA maturation RNase YbeY [Sulfurimonas sp.]MCW9068300.1 rRNA maturation RNase YbeY [Sulfurimonas sp.]
MIELDNRTLLNVDIDMLETIAQALTKKEIELIITSNEEIREINKAHRGIDKDTDVLSFPYEEMPMSPLGSIVISSSHVTSKAKELNHKTDDELALLFIHGILHLLGFDHEVDNGQMRKKEEELIEKFKLPKSLIVRTQG